MVLTLPSSLSPCHDFAMKTTLLFLLSILPLPAFLHFEARQQDPIALSPDGTRLLALHSPASSLSVFDVSNPLRSAPLLIAEIPVGTEPVTVKMRTDDEAWVVNEVSDSISIISLSARAVVMTLRCSDEPADVCFANGKAYVSCARNQRVLVFNVTTRNLVGEIAVNGLSPRALTVNADGTKVYLASLLSGNQTTILHASDAPAPPTPSDPALPAAPQTALIVPANDSRVTWNTLDHDIAEIDTSTDSITQWFSGVGTHLFDLAPHPDGTLWCANSEALNLTRFEPELNGHFARHRLSKLTPTTGAVSHLDLNPTLDRKTRPDPASIALALAQPTGITFSSDGSLAWVTAFNSDRIAKLNCATGEIVARIELRSPGDDATKMRGPRSLVLSDNESLLFVHNKLSDTISTIATATNTVLSEVPIASVDPMPAPIRQGRGLLYDARLSGNGTLSCATCHLDADRDGLGWDLGDPGGEMLAIPAADLSIHDSTLTNRTMHPMKGPMTTQTLRGLAFNESAVSNPPAAVVTKFHWRGDKPSIQSFNSTYPNLMGGIAQPAAQMDLLDQALRAIANHPNPNRNPDRSLKTDVNGGDATRGRLLFNSHNTSHCIICHSYNGGTDQNIDLAGEVSKTQSIKNPPLRLVYQRAGIFDPTPGGDSLSGFGLGSDGSSHLLPKGHPYFLDILRNQSQLDDLEAFILSFDTGTAPSVGRDLAVTAETDPAAVAAHLDLLEARATLGECGLIATGQLDGSPRSFRWDAATQRYLSDSVAEATRTRGELLSLIQRPADSLNISGVLPSETLRLGGDRDQNGILNQDEALPELTITSTSLQWPTANDIYPEASTTLQGPWLPWTAETLLENSSARSPINPEGESTRFFRLRRTW